MASHASPQQPCGSKQTTYTTLQALQLIMEDEGTSSDINLQSDDSLEHENDCDSEYDVDMQQLLERLQEPDAVQSDSQVEHAEPKDR